MKKWSVSKAMGGISDELLLEAMTYTRNERPAYRILRIAACFAVVLGLLTATLWPRGEEDFVTGPGILAVTVYAADMKPYTISSPDMVLHESIYWNVATGYMSACPIVLSVPKEYEGSEDITFQIAVNGGGMMCEVETGEKFVPGVTYQYMPAQFTVSNHTTIYWTAFHANASNEEFSMNGKDAAYVEIVIYDEENIVGYSVLCLRKMNCSEVVKTDPDCVLAAEHKECTGDHKVHCYRIEMLASVLYPMVDEKYQTIEEGYVREQIRKVKQQ